MSSWAEVEQMNDVQILDAYESMFIECLHPSEVIHKMGGIGFTQDDIKKIEHMEKNEGFSKAAQFLIGKLKKNIADDGLYVAFKQALNKAGYQYLHDALSGAPVRKVKVFKKLIQIHWEDLEEVDPLVILPALISQLVITIEDQQQIEADCRYKGGIIGMRTLLIRIPRKVDNWFAFFMCALKPYYPEIVEKIEPSFMKAGTVDSMIRVADKMGDLHSDTPSSNSKDCERAESVFSVGEHTENMDVETPTNQKLMTGRPKYMDRDTADMARSEPVEHTDEESLRLPLTLEDLTPTLKLMAQSNSTDDDTELKTVSDNLDGRIKSRAPAHREYRYNILSPLDDHTLPPISDNDGPINQSPCVLQLTLPSADLTPTAQCLQPVPIAVDYPESEIDNSLVSDIEPFEPANINAAVAPSVGELELRDYQLELAEPATTGKNTICVAPTGSGKTHVAMHIMKMHFEGGEGVGVNKVIFIVPTVALVEQQHEMFQKYLNEYKSVALSGPNERAALPVLQLMQNADILVLTPRLLADAMLRSDENRLSLADVTLLIFDECHHCNKEHPYQEIMSAYLDIKLDETDDDVKLLPQVNTHHYTVDISSQSYIP